uniref:Uncharacterized protein n=1 Tax=Davidia involucrata TaxID=16924 RepID=A0A5B6Z007_DAVIN
MVSRKCVLLSRTIRWLIIISGTFLKNVFNLEPVFFLHPSCSLSNFHANSHSDTHQTVKSRQWERSLMLCLEEISRPPSSNHSMLPCPDRHRSAPQPWTP